MCNFDSLFGLLYGLSFIIEVQGSGLKIKKWKE